MGRKRRIAELPPDHRQVLTLFLHPYTDAEIAERSHYGEEGVRSILTRSLRAFFPEIRSLDGDDYRDCLRLAGAIYLEELRQRQRLEAGLAQRGILDQLGRGARSYAVTGKGIVADLRLERLMPYVRGRIYALRLNYARAERYFEAASRARRPELLRGIILNDLASAQSVLGRPEQSRQTLEQCRTLYRGLKERSRSSDDSLWLGEARASIQEQQTWCFQDNYEQCHRFHNEAADVFDMMKTVDHYGWSKTYRTVAWCSWVRGMAHDDDKCHLGQAAVYITKSYDDRSGLRLKFRTHCESSEMAALWEDLGVSWWRRLWRPIYSCSLEIMLRLPGITIDRRMNFTGCWSNGG